MVVFVFRKKLLQAQQCWWPWRWISWPCRNSLSVHCLSTLCILLTISFAAVKNRWLHMITVRTTKKREYSRHGFFTKTVCFHMPPHYTWLPDECNIAHTLALIMLTGCSQEAADGRRWGSSICRGAWEKETRTFKGRCVVDWLTVRKDRALVWHHLPWTARII